MNESISTNRKKLYEFESKGISYDILTRVNFVLNASKDNQPELSIGEYGNIICKYKNFTVVVTDLSIQINSDNICKEYEDENAINYIKKLCIS